MIPPSSEQSCTVGFGKLCPIQRTLFRGYVPIALYTVERFAIPNICKGIAATIATVILLSSGHDKKKRENTFPLCSNWG
ncbi:hypothetical protein X975_23727, partial [Stegodyphus mimosarum]